MGFGVDIVSGLWGRALLGLVVVLVIGAAVGGIPTKGCCGGEGWTSRS